MSAEEIDSIYPSLTAYQGLIKCKNLGIMVDAEAFDMDVLDDMHTIYVAVEEVQERMRKAKSSGG